MQAKGLVKFFAIALILVCLFQLSFTFFANRVDGKANAFAEEQTQGIADLTEDQQKFELRKHKRRYLDSVSNKSAYPLLGYTYNEVKERQLNLGLDLQGGMSAVLQVTLEDMIRSLSNDSKDPTFTQALVNAREMQKSNDADYITLFGAAFQALDPNKRLAAIFNTPELQDKNITPSTPDAEVLDLIRSEGKDAIKRTYDILRARIDKFGVTQPNISLDESTGRITVELPGVDDRDRVAELLQATAQLEFWETYEYSQDLDAMMAEANKVVKDKLGLEEEAEKPKKEAKPAPAKIEIDSVALAAGDSSSLKAAEEAALNADTEDEEEEDVSLLGGEDGDSTSVSSGLNPFLETFRPVNGRQIGNPAVVGIVYAKDTSKMNEYMAMPEVKEIFRPLNTKFLLGHKPFDTNDGEKAFNIYGIKSSKPSGMKPALGGDVIDDARQDIDAQQNVVVSMNMNSEGGRKWFKVTEANVQKCVAIVLDNAVYSAPVIQNPIPGGRSQITGSFTMSEAQDLANILKAGKLPAPARIVEEAVVGPSLGQESIRNGLLSLGAGLLIVLFFMVFYYNNSGFIADLALLLNLFFVIGVLASLGATLTLPGMAGIVLTVGMAVDANVIIFERIREELSKGSGVRKAIADGYTKSYSAIIDANLTTLITAIILYYFGLGPVLGFATVLMIGIFSSLFTAILITRLIFDWQLGKDRDFKFSTAWSKNRFKNLGIDFVGRRKLGYIIAAVLFAIGFLSFAIRGFELGVDFQGGRTYVVQFDQEANTGEIRDMLTAPFEAPPLVRTYGDGNQVKITTSHLIGSTDPQSDIIVAQKLYDGLKPKLGDISYQEFTSNSLQSSQKVGPTIADDILRSSIWATVIALICIFMYIVFRFRRWQFGLAAVLTIVHDTIILLALFSLLPGLVPWSLEIDQNFIAALLTVIGYSINDTVVVFDRIREYLNLNPKRDEKEVINEAVNSTLSRTVITSLTTLLVVFILFLFGGEVIRGFSFALMVGIVVGTYSSIFIATPIVVDLSEQYAKRAAPKSTGNKKRKKVKA